MGCLFGGALARAGHRVTLVDPDPATVAALTTRGVRWWQGERWEDIPVGATREPAAAGPADLALVLVKAPHTAAAAAGLPALLAPEAPALTLQNGLGGGEVLAACLGADRVLVGVTAQGATLLGPGEARHGGRGETVLGPCRGVSPAAEGVAQLLDGALGPARAVADPWPLVWRKLAINCAINPLAALTGALNGELPVRPEAVALMAAAVGEVVAVARGAGIDLGDPEALVRAVLGVARATGANRASMGQDVDRGRPTEIDFINGAVVREGRRCGIPTPVNQTLAQLVKTLEQLRGAAGGATAASGP